MKQFLFFNIIIIIGNINTTAQQNNQHFLGEKETCYYMVTNGRINGNYSSYHLNGTKKSEGQLANGYRIGKWVVWDSTGRKRMERFYKNPFEFKRIFPLIPTEGAIPLLSENKFVLEFDSNGLIKYNSLKEENAIWRHKIWRTLLPKNNQSLFNQNNLLVELTKLALSSKINLFDTIDDRFTTTINNKNINAISYYKKIKLIGFELKEEYIFDLEELFSQYRIIGFCPIVEIDNKPQKLFWVYYPEIRQYLAKQKLSQKLIPYPIKNLDELFIFRDFASEIIKSTIDNPYDIYIKDYPNYTKKNVQIMQKLLEIKIIESENDIWIGLTK